MKIQRIQVGVDNCYLIRDESTILIDGGMPGHFSKFCKTLQNLAIDPHEIKTMIITHCHWDHIGCAKDIKELTGAKLIVHKYERNILEKGEHSMPPGVTTWGKLFGSFLDNWSKKFFINPCAADIVVEEDLSLKDFGVDGHIIFTPGHSQGSITVLLDSGDAFVGDMAMNDFPLTIAPNLPIFAEDISALKDSWRKLMAKGITTVYPAHGKPFPIENLMKKVAL